MDANELVKRYDAGERDFREVGLIGAILTGANLRGIDLRESILVAVDLRKANLAGANLVRADLWMANLEGAILTEAELDEVDLRKGKLGNANLRSANLHGTDLRGANLTDAIMPDGKKKGLLTRIRKFTGEESARVLNRKDKQITRKRERLNTDVTLASQIPPMTILLATDGSPHAQAAAQGLTAWQLPPDSQVVALSVVHLLQMARRADLYLEFEEREAREIDAALRRALTTVGQAGIQAGPMLRSGDPADTIIGAAERIGANLITLGARSDTAEQLVPIGSVAHEVVKCAR